MEKLTSKIQYNNFEVGEFIDTKKRTYNEVIDLIENFPWNKQREKIVIDLTNPSVTIERESGDFLKLAVYFNNKFVLSFLDPAKILFTKSFINKAEAYVFIKKYFDETFDSADFKRQSTWLINNLKHFVSQAFVYTVNYTRIIKFLWSTSALIFTISIFFIFLFLFIGGREMNIAVIIFNLVLFFLIGGGLNLILFFNYYFNARNKVLIMSKGNDIFYFGNINSPNKYDKKDIMQFTIKKSRSSRSPISEFSITTIEFRDGSQIKIPSLLLDDSAFTHKLFGYPKISEGGFPFIRN